jgi:H+-translocating NAD(P) transhydrogenase subunit alpha
VTTKTGARILGIPNLAGRVAADASALYARNLFAFAGLLLKDGAIAVDLEEEILKASALTHAGKIVNSAFA